MEGFRRKLCEIQQARNGLDNDSNIPANGFDVFHTSYRPLPSN